MLFRSSMFKTALHELLGHGTGKLFKIDENGKYNFDIENVINPLTNEKINSYYLPGETYESKFSTFCRALEEGRADYTALYLVFNKKAQNIFEFKEDEYEDVITNMWLTYFIGGIIGIGYYKNGKWNNPYSQERFLFLNYVLKNQEIGKEIILFNIDEEKRTFKIVLNKENLINYGKNIVSKILTCIHISKCIGDTKTAENLVNKYNTVDEYMSNIYKMIIWSNEVKKDMNVDDIDLNDPKTKKIFEKLKKIYNINDNQNIMNQNMMMNQNMINNQNMANPNMINNQIPVMNSQNSMMNNNMMMYPNMANNQNMMMYPNMSSSQNMGNMNINMNMGNMNGMNNIYMNNMYMNMNMTNNNPSYYTYPMNNCMIQNPNMINNMNNSNNQQVNQINNNCQNVNNNIRNANNLDNKENNNQKEILPRGKMVIGEIKADWDIYNLHFKTNMGSEIIININKYANLNDVIKMFCQKINIPESKIGKQIKFLYNGKHIFNEYLDSKVKDIFRNLSSIAVFDIGNIIGS